MATKGRPMGRLHQDDVRAKIQAGQLLNLLQDHALNGEHEITPTRMKAIEILLRKSIPDLSSIDLGNKPGEVFDVRAGSMTDDELAAIAARRSR